MKKVLIRLTGLLVTTAIAISGNGLVLATEVEGTGNETGTATEATAEEPKVEETSAAEETEAPAETPAEDSKSEETAAPDATPADTEDKEAPSQEEKSSEETTATNPASEKEKVVTVEEKIPGEKRSNISASSPNNININFFDDYSDDTYTCYKIIRQELSNIIGGSRTSTKFEIQTSQLSADYTNFSPTRLGVNASNFASQNRIRIQNDKAWNVIIRDYISCTTIAAGLLNACPLDMFWYQGALHSNGADFYSHPSFDVAFVCSYDSGTNKVTIHTIIFEFKVASDFKGANDYTISSAAISMARTAKAKADEIINTNKNKSDIEKLIAYKKAIADSATFFDTNSAGAEGGIEWQMIPVFDNDRSTSAVSDGYAKAFQYLCDNTTFKNSNIFAITAYGLGWTAYHTWNIVHMDDGKNYIVDILLEKELKNSAYFLGGATYSKNEGAYKIVGGDAGYTFSGDTLEFYSEYTVYSTTKYVIGDEPEPEEAPEFSSGHSMRLKDNIGMCFYITFPDNFDSTNCYVKFTAFDGKTSTVDYKDSEVKEGNTRLFIFYINPLEISDYITATLYYGDGKSITAEPYSAYDYIVAARDKLSNNTGLINLLNSLHAYGYYIQKSGWTDNRSHATIPDPIKFLTAADRASTVNSVSSFNLETNIGSSGIDSIVKTSMSIATTTELKVYVKPTSGTTITSSAPTTTINGEKYYQFSTGKLGPKSLGNPKTVTVKTNRGTATISVATIYYVKSALDSNKLSTNEEYAVIAFYNYYASALAYKG